MNPVQFTKRINALLYYHASMGSTRCITVIRAKLRTQGYSYCPDCKLWLKTDIEGCTCKPVGAKP